MITYRDGDLLTSPAQALVNPVNTVDVMGKGLARRFKAAYPAMFAEYKARCDRNAVAPGTLHLYRGDDRWILNFPTKRHWRDPSRLADIERGLQQFVATDVESGIDSSAFPHLGYGEGSLDWNSQVRP